MGIIVGRNRKTPVNQSIKNLLFSVKVWSNKDIISVFAIYICSWQDLIFSIYIMHLLRLYVYLCIFVYVTLKIHFAGIESLRLH